MDIHQLKVFSSVYRNRSFTKASEDLHLTQPTISDHIRSLEDELGCRLFDRLNHALLEDELIAVAAPSLMHQQSVTLRELIGLPMVLREEGSGTRKEMEKNLEGKGISLDVLKVSGYFSSTDAVKQAVKAGLGISILSRFSVQEELKHRTLKEVKVPGLEMKRKFYVLTHRKRSLPLLYSVFLEHLKTSSATNAA
jgi:DNA-binding transcriptional LysR family regulator